MTIPSFHHLRGLPNDVQPGTRILIDDGLVAFEVEEIKNGTDIVCKALNGGPLSNRKSINVPGIKLNMKFVSDKDREDIEFGLSQDIDFIAASFTRSAQASATSRRSSRHTARKMLRSSARSRTWKA